MKRLWPRWMPKGPWQKRWRFWFPVLYGMNFLFLCRMGWTSFASYIACYVVTYSWFEVERLDRETAQMVIETEDMLFDLLGGVIGRN